MMTQGWRLSENINFINSCLTVILRSVVIERRREVDLHATFSAPQFIIVVREVCVMKTRSTGSFEGICWYHEECSYV